MARSKSSDRWLREHVNDRYVQQARAEGLRSRAAYKLQQIASRDKLFAPGMTVVDLGAAPGGWSQVAARAVAPGGMVIGVDLLEVEPLHGVSVIRGDFTQPEVLAELEKRLEGRQADIVLSDMAPNISGVASADQARAAALAELALDFSLKHLNHRESYWSKHSTAEASNLYCVRCVNRFSRFWCGNPMRLAAAPVRSICWAGA
jgi:23S rRNA (uridine2552-2'-O)-methyltransferase